MMDVSPDYEQYRKEVWPALSSKRDEFLLFGYDNVSEADIWNFMKTQKWRKTTVPLKLHEMVQDILSLKIGAYMHYVSIEALKEADQLILNEEEMLELLK